MSHSGHVFFVDRAPVQWHSGRQTTVETSAFSLEFIAMKHCVKDIECLGFKLRMFGILINESDPEIRILCGDEAVVKNSPRIESTLNERHSAVAHHSTRWNVAARVCLVGWIPTAQDVADTVTKFPPEAKRNTSFCDWVH